MKYKLIIYVDDSTLYNKLFLGWYIGNEDCFYLKGYSEMIIKLFKLFNIDENS